jgi:lysyl-tRNA synthetase class 2
VVFRTTGDLPRIGFAALQAEGFVNLGLPWPLARRRRVAARPCTHLTGESEARTV